MKSNSIKDSIKDKLSFNDNTNNNTNNDLHKTTTSTITQTNLPKSSGPNQCQMCEPDSWKDANHPVWRCPYDV